MRIPRFLIPLLLAIAVGGGYWLCVKFNSPESFAILLILCVIGIFSYRKEPSLKSRFDGYVCEQCGAEYNCCCHKNLEDYTLVKKA
jgi:hypothetical protein